MATTDQHFWHWEAFTKHYKMSNYIVESRVAAPTSPPCNANYRWRFFIKTIIVNRNCQHDFKFWIWRHFGSGLDTEDYPPCRERVWPKLCIPQEWWGGGGVTHHLTCYPPASKKRTASSTFSLKKFVGGFLSHFRNTRYHFRHHDHWNMPF